MSTPGLDQGGRDQADGVAALQRRADACEGVGAVSRAHQRREVGRAFEVRDLCEELLGVTACVHDAHRLLLGAQACSESVVVQLARVLDRDALQGAVEAAGIGGDLADVLEAVCETLGVEGRLGCRAEHDGGSVAPRELAQHGDARLQVVERERLCLVQDDDRVDQAVQLSAT